MNESFSKWIVFLNKFDSKYFDLSPDGRNPQTVEEAAYALATWLYDNGNTKIDKLLSMTTILPEELWILGMKYWRDENHDT